MPKVKLTHRTIESLDSPKNRTSYFDTITNGLGIRVSPSGTKTFFYRYRFDGRTRRYTIGRFPAISLKEARARVRKLKVRVNDGIDPQVEKEKRKHSPDDTRFGYLSQEYKSRHLKTLRESTRSEYNRIIDVELLPKLKRLNVTEIQEYHIRNILENKALNEGSPTMANRIRSVLSSMFKFAEKKIGIRLKKNPVKLISPYKAGENKRERVYSENEIRELWSYFIEFDEPIQSIFKILLLTGQRKTETMRMRWEDIELDKPFKRTFINEAGKEVSEAFLVYVWTIPSKHAKNKKAHEVPLSKEALNIIDSMRSISGECNYVFESPRKNNQPIEWIKSSVKMIKDNSEVPDFRPHDLRRTAATFMAESGINPMIIGKVLNHKGLAKENTITARYNRHDYMEQKRKALNRWSGRLQHILKSEGGNSISQKRDN